MSWGGLNNALTAWRNAVMARFPNKDTASDGARADAEHGSTSEHQEDPDGTTDAYDMDVNLFHGSPETGSPDERRLVETLKRDFMADPHDRAQLWIHDREIANRDVGGWVERVYTGAPHDKHVHWQSRQAREDDGRTWPMPHTDALLREMTEAQEMDMAEFFASIGRACDPSVADSPDDRNNRNNFAAAVRFALGYNQPYEMATLPAGALDRIAADVASIEEQADATDPS